MLLRKPCYFDSFRCLASSCPDSCCKDWEVDLDDAALRRYELLPGDAGERIRGSIRREDDTAFFGFRDGCCPHWRTDGLCAIQAELGEETLCEVCRTYPRLTHDYGEFVEYDLELSCPEAARLMLASPAPEIREETVPGGEPGDYDAGLMELLLRTRAQALELLCRQDLTPARALAELLCFGRQIQEKIDGEALPEPDAPLRPEEVPGAMRAFFLNLEILTPGWAELLRGLHTPAFPGEARALAACLVRRRWLQAVSDGDLLGRVKFAVIACVLAGAAGGDYIRAAQLFSKEIENDGDNVDALLDAAWEHPCFADGTLLGILEA